MCSYGLLLCMFCLTAFGACPSQGLDLLHRHSCWITVCLSTVPETRSHTHPACMLRLPNGAVESFWRPLRCPTQPHPAG